jgi:hypothetical protein
MIGQGVLPVFLLAGGMLANVPLGLYFNLGISLSVSATLETLQKGLQYYGGLHFPKSCRYP